MLPTLGPTRLRRRQGQHVHKQVSNLTYITLGKGANHLYPSNATTAYTFTAQVSTWLRWEGANRLGPEERGVSVVYAANGDETGFEPRPNALGLVKGGLRNRTMNDQCPVSLNKHFGSPRTTGPEEKHFGGGV